MKKILLLPSLLLGLVFFVKGQWTQVQPSGTSFLSGIDFPTDSIGYVCGLSGKIYKTTDAGDNWSLQASGITTQFLFSVAFKNENIGIAVGNAGTILLTTNGGASWTARTSGSSQALNGSTYYNGSFYAVGAFGTLLRSDNDGVTWNSLSGPTGNKIIGIKHFNNTVILYGDNNDIYKSTNNLSSFSDISYNSALNIPTNDMFMLDEQNFFGVGGDTRIFKSTNGGTNYTNITNNATNVYNGVTFLDNESIIVGKDGTILYSSNGGNSYTQQTSGITSNLNKVVIPSCEYAIAIGAGGEILKNTISQPTTSNFSTTLNYLTMTFNNTSINGQNYSWNFGDGDTSNLENPTHIYEQGNYLVCLTSSNCSSMSEFCDSITVDSCLSVNEPSASFSYDSGSIFTFNNSSTDAISYIWDFGDGNISSEENPSNDFDIGSYFVCLTASNSCMVTSQICDSITISEPNSIMETKNIIKIYPNPANDVIKILGIENDFNIKIFNSLGKLVFEDNEINKENNIDISSLTKGTYNLKVIDKKQRIVKTDKLIIK